MLKPAFLLPGVFAILSVSAFGQSASPNGQFDTFKGDGYYWYKVDPEQEKPKPVEKPKPPTGQGAGAESKPLSTAWFRANMQNLMDMAIDNPTQENVANYMYAQRVILDKSQAFSEKTKEVVVTDPFLDENNRVPIAQYAQMEFIRNADKDKKQILKFIGERAGVWVFIDKPDKCTACASYVSNVLTSVNNGIEKEYGFSVRVINVSDEAGKIAAKRLNLKVTPTTVLVVPPSGYYLVSQGLMSSTRLSENIIIAAKTNGLLTDEYLAKVNPYDKGLLTKQDLDGFALNGDPTTVMSSLREQIKGSK